MNNLKLHTVVFTYYQKDIRYQYWSNTEESTKPDTVIFLGAGQVGITAKWVAKSAGPGVVVVGGVPHWEAAPGTWDTEKFCMGYVKTAFEAVLSKFGLESVNVVAESQAAPASINLAKTLPKKYTTSCLSSL